MRTCKTCRRYRCCLEGDREYPCRDWERRDKHGRNHSTATGARRDPAASHYAADHRPGQAQTYPAQAGAARQMHLRDRRIDLRLAGCVYRVLRCIGVFYVGTGGDLMTLRQWAAVTAVTVGIFVGMFAWAFWTA